MIHRLKCAGRFFEDVLSGAKKFEIRQDDRGFRTGDTLDLIEIDAGERETLRCCRVQVTYIVRAIDFPDGIAPGYVVMGIR